MHAFSRITLALGTTALALASSSSQAGTVYEFGSSLSNVQLLITDQSGAGSTPALSPLYTHVSAQAILPADYRSTELYTMPGSVHATLPGVQGAVQMDGAGAYSLSGSMDKTLAQANASNYVAVYTDAYSVTSFVLGAHQTFSFSALATSYMNGFAPGRQVVSGYTTAYISLEGGISYNNFSHLFWLTGFGNPAQSFSEQVSFSYTNDSNADLLMKLNVSGSANITTIDLPPVPEPASYGMLACGLLLLGAVARRHPGQV